MGPHYVVRYSRMSHIGRFAADPALGPLERGSVVVLRTARGTELGEVLAPSSVPADLPQRCILRVAGPDDHARSTQAEGDRFRRLAECERIFGDGTWPLMLVDVEPLLDDGRTVLYYLGPHHLDDAGLRDALWLRCGIDAILEPVGRDVAEVIEEADPTTPGCGSCGSDGGCGVGGCGTTSAESDPDHGHAGGCSGCSVKEWITTRERRAVPLG